MKNDVLSATMFVCVALILLMAIPTTAKHTPKAGDPLVIADQMADRIMDLSEIARPDAFNGDTVEAIQRGIKVERLVKRLKNMADEYRVERTKGKPVADDGT